MSKLDVTEAFKTKGDLRRWSAKRTVGGSVALTACHDVVQNGISWEGVCLALVGVLPLCLSFYEHDNRKTQRYRAHNKEAS